MPPANSEIRWLPIDKDSAYISFRGDGSTNRDTVEKYFLYRCAEYTLEKNFLYFSFMGKDMDKRESTYISPARTETTTTKNKDGTISVQTNSYPGIESRSIAFTKTGTIRMFRNKPKSSLSFNAKQIIKNLESQIQRKRI